MSCCKPKRAQIYAFDLLRSTALGPEGYAIAASGVGMAQRHTLFYCSVGAGRGERRHPRDVLTQHVAELASSAGRYRKRFLRHRKHRKDIAVGMIIWRWA